MATTIAVTSSSSPALPSYLEATASTGRTVETALNDVKLSETGGTRHHHRAYFSLDVEEDPDWKRSDEVKRFEKGDQEGDALVRVVSAGDVGSSTASSSSASLSKLSFASEEDAFYDDDASGDDLAESCLTVVGPAPSTPPRLTTWQQRASSFSGRCDDDEDLEPDVEFGPAKSGWSWSRTKGFDLSRAETDVGRRRMLDTNKGDVRISTAKSALVIVDMQNYFLHPAIRPHPTGLAMIPSLLQTIRRCRAHGVKVVWLNWGLSVSDLDSMPPAYTVVFGALAVDSSLPLPSPSASFQTDVLRRRRPARSKQRSEWRDNRHRDSFGVEMGAIQGVVADAGQLLMKGTWNAQVYGPLHEEWLRGRDAGADVWFDKARMSGLKDDNGLKRYLEEQGIRTLIFGGVNTDQCVQSTVVDAFDFGFDPVLCSDLCATSSPWFAKMTVEHNVSQWGFLTDSASLIDGLDCREDSGA